MFFGTRTQKSQKPPQTPRRPRRAAINRAVASTFEPLESRRLYSVSATAAAGGVLPVLHPAHVALHTAAGGIQPLGTAGPTGYTPAQVRHGYGLDRISFNGVVGDGSGLTIAIVDAFDNPNITNDLHQFDLQFGLPDPTFTKVNQRGGTTVPAADPGWASEIALDVEWSHAVAPKAKILLVEADDSSGTNLLTAVDFARHQPGVADVSMSWGGGEFLNESSFDSVFTTPAGHSGVAFLASSGDAGAPPEWPAISANVVGVGGTTLQLDGAGNYQGESGWAFSGGGISAILPQPAYQNGVVTQTSTRRASPDVAYDADPRTGFPVFDSFNNGTLAPWSQFGGTSAGAPQWAALVAIADQGRILAGKTALDGPSQLLPMLYGLPTQDFHDITAGTSFGQPNLAAGPGYDLVTGRGTPVANLLVADLVGTVNSTVTTTTTTLHTSTATAVFGQTELLTATVTTQSGVPTGTVVFTDGNTQIGSAQVDANGQATLPVSLGVGTHALTATFVSNTFPGSTSGSATVTISRAATTLALKSSANPALTGHAVTFTATVSPVAPGVGTPTGTVTFKDGSAVLGTVAVGTGGKAPFTTSFATTGGHTITAVYNGSGNFKSSARSITEQVRRPTTTALTASVNSTMTGHAVTFRATVTGPAGAAGTPTGTLTLLDGGVVLARATLDATGQAILTASFSTVGSHTIKAVYSGDAIFAASSRSLIEQVIQ
jgi:subtilase family serine protease